MIDWNIDLLADLGYESLTKKQAESLLTELMKTLEAVVGSRLLGDMNQQQIDAFERFFDAGDEGGALAWLQRNFPDYNTTVDKTLRDLRSELRQLAQPASDSEIEPDHSSPTEGQDR